MRAHIPDVHLLLLQMRQSICLVSKYKVTSSKKSVTFMMLSVSHSHAMVSTLGYQPGDHGFISPTWWSWVHFLIPVITDSFPHPDDDGFISPNWWSCVHFPNPVIMSSPPYPGNHAFISPSWWSCVHFPIPENICSFPQPGDHRFIFPSRRIWTIGLGFQVILLK